MDSQTEHQVFCGSANFSSITANQRQWIGWVYYDAYKQTYTQSILWMYAILSIVGNAAVIAWRARGFGKDKNALLSVFFISLATSDCLWGVHLLLFQIVIAQCVEVDSAFNVDLCAVRGLVFTVAAPAARFNVFIIAFYLGLKFLCAGQRCWTHKMAAYVTSTLLVVSWMLSVACGLVYFLRYYKGYSRVDKLGRDYADWTQCSPTSWGVENSKVDNAGTIFITSFVFIVLFVISTSLLFLAVVGRLLCLRKKFGSGLDGRGLSRWATVLLVAVVVNAASSIPTLFRSILVFTHNQSDYAEDADKEFYLTVGAIALQFQIVINPIIYSLAAIVRYCLRRRKRKELERQRIVGVEEWQTVSSAVWVSDNLRDAEGD